jgi:hypothetical protein
MYSERQSICHNPTLAKCGGEAQHFQSWGFGVLRDSRISELDRKAQNTLHWGVLGVIGKVLKRRYRKWPRIGHLDICSLSYGQKKGRESNWQFDSRPLKVGNRPLSDLQLRVRYVVEKILTRVTSLVQTLLRSNFVVGSYEFPKSRDSTQDSFGTISGLQPGSPGSPGKKWHSGVGAAECHRVYYRE